MHKGTEEKWRYRSTLSLTSALDGGLWSTPCLGRFTVRRAETHCTGKWAGPRTGLDVCWKSRAHRNCIPRPSRR